MVGAVNSEDQDKRVAVKVIRAFKSWMVGDTAGFDPREAKLLVEQGYAHLINPKTGEVIQPEPDPEPEPETEDDEVAIPEDWESLPFLTQAAIAKQIDPDVGSTKEPVQSAIKAELERRAGNPDPAVEGEGGADTDTQTPNQE